MSDELKTAAGLFEDDIINIVMRRLQVRLTPNGNKVEVTLVDSKTGYAFLCGGPALKIELAQSPVVLTQEY